MGMHLWHATKDRVPPYGLVVLAKNGEDGRPFKAVRILHKKHRWPVWGRQRTNGDPYLMRYAPEYWTGLDGPVEPDKPLSEPPWSGGLRSRVAPLSDSSGMIIHRLVGCPPPAATGRGWAGTARDGVVHSGRSAWNGRPVGQQIGVAHGVAFTMWISTCSVTHSLLG